MPLLYFNLAGMLAGAVWIGLMSQWHVIWLGVMTIFFSPYLIPLLMMPAGILSHFMALYQNAGQHSKERLMFFLSLAYILLFITTVCVGIFEYVVTAVRPEALYAALLWGSTAAMSPFLLWSSRDRGNVFIMTTVEVAQIAILALCLIRLLGFSLSFWPAFVIFGGILGLATAVQAFFESRQNGPR